METYVMDEEQALTVPDVESIEDYCCRKGGTAFLSWKGYVIPCYEFPEGLVTAAMCCPRPYLDAVDSWRLGNAEAVVKGESLEEIEGNQRRYDYLWDSLHHHRLVQ